MFTALAFFAGTIVLAVGAAHTKPGRRLLNRWTGAPEERIGLHRVGNERKKSEAYNKAQAVRPKLPKSTLWDLDAIVAQLPLIQNAPSW